MASLLLHFPTLGSDEEQVNTGYANRHGGIIELGRICLPREITEVPFSIPGGLVGVGSICCMSA